MSLPDATDATAALAQVRHLFLDLDGTLYRGSHLFPQTVPFLTRLKRLGIGYTFLTNNPSKDRATYLAHLAKLGIPCEGVELYTSAHATVRHLGTCLPSVRRIFFLGTPGMVEEFARAGYTACEGAEDEPDAVVISFDPGLTYEKACRAAWWIARGKPYIATHPDQTCPTDRPTLLPDCGSLCALLRSATGRDPDAIPGKPDPATLRAVLDRHRLQPWQAAMVGDRLNTDIAMAHRAGVFGVLVLTGEAVAADVENAPEPPDLVVADIGELGACLLSPGAMAGRHLQPL